MSIGRAWRAALLLAVGAAGGGAAWALASVPDSNGVIHACVQLTKNASGISVPDQASTFPDVTVIDPGAGQHCTPPDGTIQNQTELSWNVTGPAGAPGTNGTNGANGANGAPGRTVTITRGPTYTINFAPTIRPDARPLGTASLSIGLGRPLGFGVLGYSLGTPTTSAARAGKVHVQDITITKKLDKASPKLFSACATGKHIPKAVITIAKQTGGKRTSFVITLTDVVITSVQQGAAGGADPTPTESLTLNFTKVEYKSLTQ